MTDLSHRFAGYAAFLRTCLTLLRPHRRLVLGFMGLSLASGMTEGVGITLLVPILTAAQSGISGGGNTLFGPVVELFDRYPTSQRIQMAAMAMLVVLVARGVMQYCVNFLAAYLPIRLERSLALKAFEGMSHVELSFMHQRDDGQLLNALTNWVLRTTDVLNGLAIAVWTSVLLGVYLTLMLVISVKMTVSAGVLLLGLSLLVRRITTGPLSRTGRDLNRVMAAINQIVLESLNGIKLIRLQASEDKVVDTYRAVYDEYVQVRRRWYTFLVLPGSVMTIGTGIFICLALIFSQMGGQAPDMAISKLIVFLFVLSRIVAPVSALNDARARVVSNIPFFDDLNGFITDMGARRQPSGDRAVGPLASGIRFDNVSFAYDGTQPVIQNLSLDIAKGEMVAVVGPSGAGKSTLMSLITRLYEPTSGRILVDGVPLAELDVRSWRRRVGVVSQDTFLFNDTVANNIAFGIPGADREAARRAAEMAAAAEFIERLPDGYDTVLGDRGVRLSGGQQQRLAIARAILADPDLFILDEATSHLDTYSERAIQQAVEKLAKGRTVIVIAHRLSTVRRADRVVVLAGGRIAEMGRHDELMAQRGAYWDMVTHQQLELVEGESEDSGQGAALDPQGDSSP
jgi:ATP-binding cassette, subfamily B, bacterial MsbA